MNAMWLISDGSSGRHLTLFTNCMSTVVGRLGLLGLLLAAGANSIATAAAIDCNGKPDALGVSRIIAVDPTEHRLVGSMQYPETLPLADHEVVLTFDDGPSPKYTDRILETLASQCVKATFFMVGEMAKLFPEEARKVAAQGHTIGTHSFHHPFTFDRMTEAQAGAEIDKGIEAVGAALENPAELAPFFRVPGFLTSKTTEAALASRGLMTWSADVPSDDWRGISSDEIVRRVMSRLETKSRGIILFHDIHEHTVAALPELLKELREHGYRVVQVVPASDKVAKTETTPDQWKLPPEKVLQAEEGAKPAAEEPGPARHAKALGRVRNGHVHVARAKGVRRHVAGERTNNRRLHDGDCRGHQGRRAGSCASAHRNAA
ncbi:MAG TPA: polysaccharide deacetylase family protein [Terriglobales bacterium]|nr:polysaccharide deacetylase family protein [Terriglobales bacterium]